MVRMNRTLKIRSRVMLYTTIHFFKYVIKISKFREIFANFFNPKIWKMSQILMSWNKGRCSFVKKLFFELKKKKSLNFEKIEFFYERINRSIWQILATQYSEKLCAAYREPNIESKILYHSTIFFGMQQTLISCNSWTKSLKR